MEKRWEPIESMQEVVIEPAQNQTQQEILDIAIDTLGTDRIGITTDLFAAGMSSISGMKFCALLSAKYNKDLRIADIAGNSTVVDIEKLLDDSGEIINHEVRDEYPLSMNQMGIYIETELNKGTTIYNIPTMYKLDDRVDLDKLRKAIVKAASAHPYFFLDTHHIVSDGASIDILVEDIDKVYKGEEVSEETYTGFEYALDEE